MRIAFNGWFLDQPRTGSGQYVRQLLSHLLQIAPEHTYFSITPEAIRQVTDVGPPLPQQAGNRKPGLRKVWFEQVTFPRACRRLGADLAHVPYWGSPLASTVSTVVTVHDLVPLLLPEYRGNALVRAYTQLVSSAAERAALVLTDSQASKKDLLTYLDLRRDRVRVVYLAVGPAFSPDPAPDDDEIRARYDLPDEYVLYLGNVDVRKNLVGLLQAWTFAEGFLGEYTPLVIAGPLPEHSAFTPDPRRIAQALEIAPETVIFTGPPPEGHKPALYRGARCYLFASRYEGFGLTALEALSCGVPVVGSDASSIPEVVGDAGILVPPDDVRGMAGALIAVATESEMRQRLSERALAQAARFSWAETARQTLAAYQDVLSRSPGKTGG